MQLLDIISVQSSYKTDIVKPLRGDGKRRNANKNEQERKRHRPIISALIKRRRVHSVLSRGATSLIGVRTVPSDN